MANPYLKGPYKSSYTPGANGRFSASSKPAAQTESRRDDVAGGASTPRPPRGNRRFASILQFLPVAVASGAFLLALRPDLPKTRAEAIASLPTFIAMSAGLAQVLMVLKEFRLALRLVLPVLVSGLIAATMYVSELNKKAVPPAPPSPIKVERYTTAPKASAPAPRRPSAKSPARSSPKRPCPVIGRSTEAARQRLVLEPREGFESQFEGLQKGGLEIFTFKVPATWDQQTLDQRKGRWAKACGVDRVWIDQWSRFRGNRDGCQAGGTCVVVAPACAPGAFDADGAGAH